MLLVLIAAGVAGTVGYVRWQKAKSAAVGPSLASTATGTAPGAGSLATSTTSRSPFVTPEGSGEVRASTSASANANADAGRNGDASTNGDAGGASAAGDASASAVSAATSSAATTDAGVDARAATPLEAGVVATADDIPAGMGRVKTEGTVPGRRIFVDERTVGQTPESVLVKCGARNVKLGSTGFVRSVEVPCGGEIVIGDR